MKLSTHFPYGSAGCWSHRILSRVTDFFHSVSSRRICTSHDNNYQLSKLRFTLFYITATAAVAAIATLVDSFAPYVQCFIVCKPVPLFSSFHCPFVVCFVFGCCFSRICFYYIRIDVCEDDSKARVACVISDWPNVKEPKAHTHTHYER